MFPSSSDITLNKYLCVRRCACMRIRSLLVAVASYVAWWTPLVQAPERGLNIGVVQRRKMRKAFCIRLEMEWVRLLKAAPKANTRRGVGKANTLGPHVGPPAQMLQGWQTSGSWPNEEHLVAFAFGHIVENAQLVVCSEWRARLCCDFVELHNRFGWALESRRHEVEKRASTGRGRVSDGHCMPLWQHKQGGSRGGGRGAVELRNRLFARIRWIRHSPRV